MKRILSYSLIAAISLSLCSCSREEVAIGVSEGEPAQITFVLNKVEAQTIETKGMTDPQEQAISRLFLFIFGSDGILVNSEKFSSVSGPITMEAYSGNGMQIFAVANYSTATDVSGNPGIESQLGSVSTVEELHQVIRNLDGVSAVNPERLTLVGNITKTINVGNSNSATIDLRYIAAKITIKVIDATENNDVTFFGWEAYNLPLKGYLFPNATDAVNPSSTSDFYNIEGNNMWEKEELLDDHHTLSQSFYMLENRRGSKDGLTYSSDAYKQKTANAVDFPGASYFKLSMNCNNRTDGNTYMVTTLVYLGANNYSDYNIERSKHYTYTIRISGVNSITVDVSTDSNSTASSLPISITSSSTMTMDAHPDMRVLNLRGDTDQVDNVSIEIVGETPWLKLSPLNLWMHQVSQAAPNNLYQQPAPAAGYFVRPRYIPHKSFREANTSLSWSEWPSVSDPDYDDDRMKYADATYRMCYALTELPFTSEGDKEVIVCVYADEYQYLDGLTSRTATLRISYDDKADHGIRKYFDYDIQQKQPMNVGLVVDTYSLPVSGAFLESNTTYRHAVIEQIEESSIMLLPNSPYYQQTTQMQWGYNGHQLYSSTRNTQRFDNYRNGYYLTANAVYGNGNNTNDYSSSFVLKNSDGSGVDWSSITNNYRPKYGSRLQNTDSPNLITEPSYTSNNSGAPYFLPNISSSRNDNVFYNPVFNSSAARYCHEKNRDLNGNGEIDPSETQWYLPSQHELYQVWVSLEAIRYSTTEYGTGYYWSSSEGSSNSVHQLGFETGYTSSSASSKTGIEQSVRCIRKIASGSDQIIVMNDRIIDSNNLPADAKTAVSKGSGTGMQGNAGISTNSATVYVRFQVAKNDATAATTYSPNRVSMAWRVAAGYSDETANGVFTAYNGSYNADTRIGLEAGTITNGNPNAIYMHGAPMTNEVGCAAYYEKADASDKGSWRLPNKREMYLIWIYRAQLESMADFTAFSGNYWTASEREKGRAHTVNMYTGIGENPAKTAGNKVRCIREL